MFNTIVGAGAVGAGTASRYGSYSGSDQMVRLLAAPAPQHWIILLILDPQWSALDYGMLLDFNED
jgi:hypothetical protein